MARHEALPEIADVAFGDIQLLVPRGVFCPTLTNTSPLLLQATDFRAEERVLDAFCGSGAFGLIAAVRYGCHVVAVDVDPRATIAAQLNACRYDVDKILQIVTAPVRDVPDQQFDLMLANPPLLPGEPHGIVGRAVYDPMLQGSLDFVDVVSRNLASAGRALLLTSDVLDRTGLSIDSYSESRGLRSRVKLALNVGYETYRVHELTRQP